VNKTEDASVSALSDGEKLKDDTEVRNARIGFKADIHHPVVTRHLEVKLGFSGMEHQIYGVAYLLSVD
jgi:hypothetical protein